MGIQSAAPAAARAIFPSHWCLHGPWFSALVWALPLHVGLRLMSVFHLDMTGQKQQLIRAHLFSWSGEREGYGRHIGVCGECPLRLRPAGSRHTLGKVVHLPRGVGLRLWVPRQSQAAQASGTVWAVTCAHSRDAGSCSPWGRDHSGLLSTAPALTLAWRQPSFPCPRLVSQTAVAPVSASGPPARFSVSGVTDGRSLLVPLALVTVGPCLP